MRKFILFLIFVLIATPSMARTFGDVTINGDLVITQDTDCSTKTTSGLICYDTDDDKMYVGNGVDVTEIGTGAGGSSVLDDLTDIGTSTATSGNLLVADGTQFNATTTIPAVITANGFVSTSADSYLNVSRSSDKGAPDEGDVWYLTTTDRLRLFNGTNTVNIVDEDNFELDGLSDIGTSTATAGNILQADGTNFDSVALSTAVGALTKVACATIIEPDVVQAVIDNVPLLPVDSTRFPNGVEATHFYLYTDTSSSYTLGVEMWSSPEDGAPDTMTTISTSSTSEADEAPDTEGSVSAGDIIMLDLSTDDVNWIEVCVDFVEPSE